MMRTGSPGRAMLVGVAAIKVQLRMGALLKLLAPKAATIQAAS